MSTILGAPSSLFNDGPGLEARFNTPIAIASDDEGRLYVADYFNNRIRVVEPSGEVWTLAGDGFEGYADGQGERARFFEPCGIAVDRRGYVYVADSRNNRIRVIDPQGQVSTLAGDGLGDHRDGPALEARFNHPSGVAVDHEGNVYVADHWNHTIRKIDPSGVVSTLAGSPNRGFFDAPGTLARFNYPTGLILDDEGNIYVADSENHSIRKIDPYGSVSTLAGNGNHGFVNARGREAEFEWPLGLAIDREGNIFVADNGNNMIRAISPSGDVSTLAGGLLSGHRDGAYYEALFSYPEGVAVDQAGNIYVADTGNNLIRGIDRSGNVRTLAGSSEEDLDQIPPTWLEMPTGLALDSQGLLYISDTSHDRILVLDREGNPQIYAGTGRTGLEDGSRLEAEFNWPTGIALDPVGNLYVADTDNNLVRKIDPHGEVSSFAGSGWEGYADGQGSSAAFALPWALAFDRDGNLLVADVLNYMIRSIDPQGNVSTLIFEGPEGQDLGYPFGLAIDQEGSLYIAEGGNHRILKLDTDGNLSVFAGSGEEGFADGAPQEAMFAFPGGLAFDNEGNLYVTDTDNHAIRRIDPQGNVSTIAGTGSRGYLNGPGREAEFFSPSAIAIDQDGTIYVADSENNRIRMIQGGRNQDRP